MEWSVEKEGEKSRREQREGKGWGEPEVWEERRGAEETGQMCTLSLRVTCM